jgi:3-deoxy-D-manno-oct-2-ulosonic acid (Kdo) hydroxylase
MSNTETKTAMMRNANWIAVEDYKFPGGWTDSATGRGNSADGDKDDRARALCRELEAGNILFFPKLPYEFPSDEREFLLSREWNELRLHKNVSYRPADDVMRGFSGDHDTQIHLHHIVRNYSAHVVKFLRDFLRPYAGKWKLDFASFRPFEEEGRDLSLHKRNDLLHVDAFRLRPTRGGRILRVFTNLHATKPRVWYAIGDFGYVAEKYAADAGVSRFAAKNGALRRSVSRWAAGLGLARLSRTPYDRFMLRFHDYLKENDDFQRNSPKVRLEFPPGATWMVFTDGVAHAAMSGQFAVEQTLLIPPEALVAPESAPYRILERIAATRLC